MILETFPVGPLACNCTIVADEVSGRAIVIDPGGQEAEILGRLAQRSLTVQALLHTHTHFDHIGATAAIQQVTGSAARIHVDDLEIFRDSQRMAQAHGIHSLRLPQLDTFLEDGDVISVGDLSLEVIHTPGHTPGSVCFHCSADEGTYLFSGDTLFAGAIGGTDGFGGDFDLLMKSISNRLLTLPAETVIIPGHQGKTTVGREASRFRSGLA